MEKQNLINLIKDSYLSESEKDELVQYLDKNDADDKFFETFGQKLTKRFEVFVERYKKLTDDFDKETDELDRQHGVRAAELQKARDERLKEAGIPDSANADNVWTWYDTEIEKLRNEHVQETEKVCSKLASGT